MGYRAYHEVSRYISRDERDEPFWPLIMPGNDYATVKSLFYLSSAYAPDGIEGPSDVIQEHVNSSNECSENGGDFTWGDKELQEIIDEIKEQWPDHKDTPGALAALEEIRKRVPGDTAFDFVCF